MEKNLATRLINAAFSLDPILGEIDSIISDMTDPVLKHKYTSALGNLLKVQARDFIFPIAAEYPDLDRDAQRVPRSLGQ